MTISPDRRWLVVMLKDPKPGRVKTRLGRDIGTIPATWWYRHQVARTLRDVRGSRWQVILAVSPDIEGLASRSWPSDLPRMAQGPGNLGDRMGRIFRALPPGPALIIGSDVPGIDRTAISEAFDSLRGHDAVIGPAPDGGYWLVGVRGQRALPQSLFQDVRWSTEHAMADTLASFGDYRVAQIRTLRDVDRAQDL